MNNIDFVSAKFDSGVDGILGRFEATDRGEPHISAERSRVCGR